MLILHIFIWPPWVYDKVLAPKVLARPLTTASASTASKRSRNFYIQPRAKLGFYLSGSRCMNQIFLFMKIQIKCTSYCLLLCYYLHNLLVLNFFVLIPSKWSILEGVSVLLGKWSISVSVYHFRINIIWVQESIKNAYMCI